MTNTQSLTTRDHGYPIITSKVSNNGGKIIIAKRDHPYHPFVVWHMYDNGSCEGGGYYSTQKEAYRDYLTRY